MTSTKRLPDSRTQFAFWLSDYKDGTTNRQRIPVKPGDILRIGDPKRVNLCGHGYHASLKPSQAKGYHSGPFIWLVRIPKKTISSHSSQSSRPADYTIEGHDKVVSTYREYIACFDISKVEVKPEYRASKARQLLKKIDHDQIPPFALRLIKLVAAGWPTIYHEEENARDMTSEDVIDSYEWDDILDEPTEGKTLEDTNSDTFNRIVLKKFARYMK